MICKHKKSAYSQVLITNLATVINCCWVTKVLEYTTTNPQKYRLLSKAERSSLKKRGLKKIGCEVPVLVELRKFYHWNPPNIEDPKRILIKITILPKVISQLKYKQSAIFRTFDANQKFFRHKGLIPFNLVLHKSLSGFLVTN